MKRYAVAAVLLACLMPLGLTAQEKPTGTQSKKILLLITEQNINGPQRAWWSSEIDLSLTEAALSEALSDSGYEVVQPESARAALKEEPAYRMVSMRECRMVELANLQQAEYIIKGRALATGGSALPQSGMRSHYATATARIIRVKDGRSIAFLEAWGKSAHVDAVAGGSEALKDTGRILAGKIIKALNKEGAR